MTQTILFRKRVLEPCYVSFAVCRSGGMLGPLYRTIKRVCITYGINVVSNMIIQYHDTRKEREKKIFHMKHYLLMPPNTTLTTYIYSITITNVSCNSKSLTLQSKYFPFLSPSHLYPISSGALLNLVFYCKWHAYKIFGLYPWFVRVIFHAFVGLGIKILAGVRVCSHASLLSNENPILVL
jgi:hypothetical protein